MANTQFLTSAKELDADAGELLDQAQKYYDMSLSENDEKRAESLRLRSKRYADQAEEILQKARSMLTKR